MSVLVKTDGLVTAVVACHVTFTYGKINKQINEYQRMRINYVCYRQGRSSKYFRISHIGVDQLAAKVYFS